MIEGLAPNWDDAPVGTTHYVIHADGKACWMRVNPKGEIFPIPFAAKWSYQFAWWTEPAGLVEIPIGVDWRLCKWESPKREEYP